MGNKLRQWTEWSRQKLHVAERGFVPTTNERNVLMLQEADEFAAHLKRCEQDIAQLKAATEAMFTTAKIVLSAPLPRVYEEAPNGKAQPVVPGNRPPGLIGGEFNAEELGRVSKETGKKLDAEVLAPMQRWLTAHATVKARMKRLEVKRLEVDSRRRTVAGLGKKVEEQRVSLPQTREKGEIKLEGTVQKLHHKESKLSAAKQAFREHESIVYQQLQQLIRDAVWLKSYIAAVLRVEQEAFTSAHAAIGPTTAQMPVLPESSVSAVPASPDMMAHPEMGVARLPSRAGTEHMGGPPDYMLDAPSAPTHRYPPGSAPAQPQQYDRYGGQYAAQPMPVAAQW